MRVRLFAFLLAYGIGAVASAQNIATFDEIVDASFENAVSTSGESRTDVTKRARKVGSTTGIVSVPTDNARKKA